MLSMLQCTSKEFASQGYKNLRQLLFNKYGEPENEERGGDLFSGKSSSEAIKAEWELILRPSYNREKRDNIAVIQLDVSRLASGTLLSNYALRLHYTFVNYTECQPTADDL